MARNRFERIITGTFEERSKLVDANVIIEDIDRRSGYEFSIEWDEKGFLSAGRGEQNFKVTGATDGASRDQEGNERSKTLATEDNGQSVVWTVAETSEDGKTVSFRVRQELGKRSDSDADTFVYEGISSSELLDGSSNNERVFLNGGNDIYYSSDNRSSVNGGVDTVYGNSGNDTAYLYNRSPSGVEEFAGTFFGGSGTDKLYLNGGTGDYEIYQHGETMVYRHQEEQDGSNLGKMIAKSVDVERLENVPLEDLSVIDGFSVRARATVGDRPDEIGAIRDFDGNDLGAGGGWTHIGTADVQYDNDAEYIFVNTELGRWATVGPDENGGIDFGNHGAGGDTRVVGVYIDPEVEAGRVEKGSEFDSQKRFENDLRIDNLTVVDAFDFNADGLQELYFETNDGTAYLRALMHADGNIQYANYQSAEQVDEYLSDLGYGQDVIDTILM
ncbi:MAG: hypothetical protein AAGH38_10030 [Pseudomonadota bacterium]